MSLDIRKKYFEKLRKKFRGKKVNNLMFEVNIPKNLFYNIKSATINYISKSFDDGEVIVDEKILIKKLLIKKKKIANMTPNGMMVPKKEISLEFNNVIKAYVEILKYFNFTDLVENFHFPPNVRIKYPKVGKSNLSRKHPTELMHSDTWTGANPNWYAVHIFLLGDIFRNNIRYAEPPNEFKEDWLKPLKFAEHGSKISNKFKLLKYTPKKGYMIVADTTIIHQSFRKKNAGMRVSLDTGFDMSMKQLKSFKKTIVDKYNVKKIRKKETISKDDFLNIGKKTYFHFKDGFDKKVFSKGGFRHPTSPKLIRLEK